jgi:hypothetical protein
LDKNVPEDYDGVRCEVEAEIGIDLNTGVQPVGGGFGSMSMIRRLVLITGAIVAAVGAIVAAIAVAGVFTFVAVQYTREPDLQDLVIVNTTTHDLRILIGGRTGSFDCAAQSTCIDKVYRGSVGDVRAYRRGSQDPIEPQQVTRKRSGRVWTNSQVF